VVQIKEIENDDLIRQERGVLGKVRVLVRAHLPLQPDQIVVFNLRDLYHTPPGSGGRQYKARILKWAI